MPKFSSASHRMCLYLNQDLSEKTSPEEIESIKMDLTITSNKTKKELLGFVDNLRDLIIECIETNYTSKDEEPDFDNWEVFLWAAKNGRQDIIALLSEKGINGYRQTKTSKKTALSDCTKNLQDTENHNKSEKEATLKNTKASEPSGSKTNIAEDKYAMAALKWAAKNGHNDIMKMLLNK